MTSTPDRRTTPITPYAVAAGMAAGVVMLGLWALLYGLTLTPFPPFDLADLVIQESPGALATWAIETFDRWAKPLLLLSGILGWVGFWGLLGYAGRRGLSRRNGVLAGLALLPVVLVLAALPDFAMSIGRVIWLVIAFGATLAFGGWLLARWTERLNEIERERAILARDHRWLDQPDDLGRRALLQRIAGAATLAVVGGLAGGYLRNADITGPPTAAGTPLDTLRADLGKASETTAPVALPTPQPAAPVRDEFDAPAGVRPRITDNADFYYVSISTVDPRINEDQWALRVRGLVDREILLSYRDLLDLPAIELDGTLMCISYRYQSGLISTTRWTGVRLRDVLELAGVRDGAVDLACRGAGGYSDSITLAKGLEPTTLIAYGMNGEALPRSHGFPCRLYVPDIYGMKNVKWLEEIEVVGQDYQGFWQERGWSDTAVVNTISVIDTPDGPVSPDVSGVVPVGGIAFAGSRGIQSVQLRIDDGPWLDAELEPNEPELIWQRWRYDWTPEQGEHRLTVRAVDGTGAPQIVEEAPPHPDGMTGLHSVSVAIV